MPTGLLSHLSRTAPSRFGHRGSALATLVVMLAGCSPQSGGQSGSEGSFAPPCPCTLASGKTPLRATLLTVAAGCVTLEVQEVLSPESDPRVQPGSLVGGANAGVRACNESGLALEPGTDVLAFYSPGADDSLGCVEYLACSTDRCGTFPDETASEAEMAAWDSCDEACLAETRSACEARAGQALLNGQVRLVRWEDPLDFGVSGTLPLDQLDTLLSADGSDSECYSIFTPSRSVDTTDSTSPQDASPPPDDGGAPPVTCGG